MRYCKRKHIFIVLICTVFVICLNVSPIYADIYMYIDKKGNYYFTDSPNSSKYKLFLREKRAKPSGTHSTDRYDKFIHEASKRHGVSFSLLKAMIKVESDFNPRAVSEKGAMGLMQIMPENLRNLQINNPFDPRENIMGGTRYIKQLLNRFDGEIHLSLAAYNAGPSNVDSAKGIPRIKETEEFVKKVMKHYYGLERNKRYMANGSR